MVADRAVPLEAARPCPGWRSGLPIRPGWMLPVCDLAARSLDLQRVHDLAVVSTSNVTVPALSMADWRDRSLNSVSLHRRCVSAPPWRPAASSVVVLVVVASARRATGQSTPPPRRSATSCFMTAPPLAVAISSPRPGGRAAARGRHRRPRRASRRPPRAASAGWRQLRSARPTSRSTATGRWRSMPSGTPPRSWYGTLIESRNAQLLPLGPLAHVEHLEVWVRLRARRRDRFTRMRSTRADLAVLGAPARHAARQEAAEVAHADRDREPGRAPRVLVVAPDQHHLLAGLRHPGELRAEAGVQHRDCRPSRGCAPRRTAGRSGRRPAMRPRRACCSTWRGASGITSTPAVSSGPRLRSTTAWKFGGWGGSLAVARSTKRCSSVSANSSLWRSS